MIKPQEKSNAVQYLHNLTGHSSLIRQDPNGYKRWKQSLNAQVTGVLRASASFRHSWIQGSREPSLSRSIFLCAVFMPRSCSLHVAAKMDSGLSGHSEFLQLAVQEEKVTSVIFSFSLSLYVFQTSQRTLMVSVLGPMTDQSPLCHGGWPCLHHTVISAACENHLAWEEGVYQ